MKLDQVKAIPLERFLAILGFQPARSQHGQLWYLSPLREERTASFKVNTDLNLWFDFGLGMGGTIVDFAMHYAKLTTVSAALKSIASAVEGDLPQVERRPSPVKLPFQSKLELNHCGPIRNIDLKKYLTQRGIRLRACASEICELHYSTHANEFVAIGFASDSGGYEIRNRSFKGTMGSKSISTREGKQMSAAIVFEGFFDYLTYLTLWGRPSSLVIVLNSVSFRERAVESLRKHEVKRVDLFRDNDDAGNALLAYFQECLPLVEVVDQARPYSDHKDLNEWHVSNLKLRMRA